MRKQHFVILFGFLSAILVISALIYYQKLCTTYILPAEFENQQAIWLQSPEGHYVSDGMSVYSAFIDIIRALEPHIKVNLVAESKDEIADIQESFKTNGISGKNVIYYVVNHYSIWARDVGPLFVKNRLGKLNVVDFGFNNYGKGASRDFIDVESNIHKSIAQQLGLPLISTNLVTEGGAIESNGRGTLMTIEAVALNRNPGLTRNQIESEYKRVLGVKKIIWLKQGLAEDDLITKGHIDEVARFVSPDTIFLAQVLPGDINTNSTSYDSYQRLEESYNILRNSTDQDGKPFNIIRIPMPPTLYSQMDATGKIPVRSYLNYAVTDGAVVMPSYWTPGRSDELKSTETKVRGIFQSVFPGRRIIAVNVESINFWGGGIHCVTQHMPAVRHIV
jgi:agmatine deiminase